MLPCGTPQLRVRADDSLPLTLHFIMGLTGLRDSHVRV